MLLRARSVLGHLRRAAVAYVVLVVALILTLLVCYYVSQKVEDSRRVDFDKTVQTAQEEINRQVVSYVDALRGARGLFYASDSIKEDEWGRYANGIELEDRYQGMQALGYA